MSDVRPSLENRLSSRLSRSLSPGNRLMERVARHSGDFTNTQRASDRRLGMLSRMEAFGAGHLGALISRLATRGAFRSSMPAYGSFGDAFVTQAPPWLASGAEEAPEAAAPASGWYQSMRAITPRVPTFGANASIARSAARPPGFSGARRSALSSPELISAAPPIRGAGSTPFVGASVARSSWGRPVGTATVARSSSRPVSALSRAAAAGMAASDFVGARVARQSRMVGAPSVHRALSRASGTEYGAADSAVSRSVQSTLPISSAGRALARAESSRATGRGFAVARSADSYTSSLPELGLARQSLGGGSEVEASGPFGGESAPSGWARPVGAASTSRLVRSSSSRDHLPARVARTVARAEAVQRASNRPLARAAAASAFSEASPRSFTPMTSPARRSADTARSPFVGALTASPLYRSTVGASTAGPLRSGPSSTASIARSMAPVERALARSTRGSNQATRAAIGALPRMSTSLSAGAMEIASPGPIARSFEPDASRPMTGGSVSGWAQPSAMRSAAPSGSSRPLTRSASRGAAPLPSSTARVARAMSRPLTGARVARAEYSAFAPAPTAGPAMSGPGSTARVARSSAGGTYANTRTSSATGVLPTSTARVARQPDGDTASSARVARSEGTSPTSTARVARQSDGSPRSTARIARSEGASPVSTTRTASGAAAGPASTARVARQRDRGFTPASVAGAWQSPDGSTASIARSSRSARMPTAVARAAANSTPFVGARVARGAMSRLADRVDNTTSTVARSMARGMPAASSVARRSFAASAAPTLTLPDAPIALRSAEATAAVSDGVLASDGWARSTGFAPSSPFVGARTADVRRSSAPPAARALARFEAPISTARTANASYGSHVGAATAGPSAAGSVSAVSVARSARASATGAGMSRLLARDAVAGPTRSGERAVARSMTSAATLGTPIRRSRLSGIDGTLASAPVARSEGGPGMSPTERVVQGFSRPESTARTAGPGSMAARSTAPTARALARAGVAQASGAPVSTPSAAMLQRAAHRLEGPARRADGGRARPMTASRSVDGTLPQLPARHAASAAQSTAPTGLAVSRSFSGARTAQATSGPTIGAAVARSESSAFVGARTSSVNRAVARSGDQTTGTAVGLGFQSPRTAQRRAVAQAAYGSPSMPVVTGGIARSQSAAMQPGFDPAMLGGSTTIARSGWGAAPTGPTMTPVRTPSLARRADRAEARRSATRTSDGARRAVQGGELARSTAPTARAAARSAEGARVSRWSSSVFQGASLARAVGRTESLAGDGTGSLRRQAQAPADAAAGWSGPTSAKSSAVRRRTQARSSSAATEAVARAESGGFGSDLMVRLKKLQSSGGLGGSEEIARSSGLDAALPSADGMVQRAASKMLSRHEEKARRRSAAGSPKSTATVSRTETGAMPIADLARMIQREVSEMTHITAAAPTISRSARKAIARSSSAQEAQGRGADRDVGKKPDLDDFLRRAVRRVMVEEAVVQSRELSFLD